MAFFSFVCCSRLSSSVRSAAKRSRCSSRARHDSGYESNEEIGESYLQRLIAHHRTHEQIVHVYPVLHGPRSPPSDRRQSVVDEPRSSSSLPGRYLRQSMSMSPDKSRRVSSSQPSPTLKPIIHRRSTIFSSSIGSLIRVAGSPRLNNDDETYISTRFRSENTSKFVIGTLWNTFALVNNLFLQRPRRRRNAIAGDTSIQAEQLAHLERLYSLAEQNRDEETPFNTRRPPTTERVTNLQAILFDVLSAIRDHPCSCYDNQHLASCPFYDHSVPYLRSYSDRTSRLERIVADLHKAPRRDASTQSSEEKPVRLTRPAVQHASTQFRSTRDPVYINVLSSAKPEDLSQRSFDASTQYSPMVVRPRVITVERLRDLPGDLRCRDSSTSPMEETSAGGKPHTVRSLVSMFENSPTESHLPAQDDDDALQVLVPDDLRLLHLGHEDEAQSSITYGTIEHYADDVASSILEDAVLTATTTAVHHDDERRRRRFSFYNNAGGHGKSLLFQSNTFVPLLSASVDVLQDEKEENVDALDDRQHFTGRRFAQALSRLVFLLVLVASRGPSRSLTPRHTLIVGRHIDVGRRKHRGSAIGENQADSSSLSSFDGEPSDQRHFLSNSQLFSAQSLYIRPWLVRRATAPDIHCLDQDLSDTRVETSSSTLFSIFPADSEQLDLFTRWTSLISLLFYLHDVHDEHANGLLYEEIDRTEEELRHQLSISTSNEVHSNVFQTINPDGSKRYRTGLVLDVNQGSTTMKIEAKQIDWKRVKLVVRRFRKKYLRHRRQLIRNDTRIDPSPARESLDVFLRYSDSTSKRRVKKFARHYAEKV